MNWLRKIEDIIKFSLYLKEKYHHINIRFKKNSNEKDAKQEFGESLYLYSSNIMKNNDYYWSDPEITISYYLDENTKDYVETSSGQELIGFVTIKCKALDSFKNYLIYKEYDDIDHQLYLINKAVNDKNINDIYELLFLKKNINKNYKTLFNVFNQLFESIFEEIKNYIFSYIKETSAIANEPNHDNCLYSIKYKFCNFFGVYILPCLLFNSRLRIFCEDINGYFGDACYKIYINFNEIINSIIKQNITKIKN